MIINPAIIFFLIKMNLLLLLLTDDKSHDNGRSTKSAVQCQLVQFNHDHSYNSFRFQINLFDFSLINWIWNWIIIWMWFCCCCSCCCFGWFCVCCCPVIFSWPMFKFSMIDQNRHFELAKIDRNKTNKPGQVQTKRGWPLEVIRKWPECR